MNIINNNLINIIIVITIAFLFGFISINLFYEIFVPNNCSLNIFIAILSQRNHFNKRQTLRQTWIQTIDEINKNNNLIEFPNNCKIKVKTRFIIGDKDCDIHPILRTTPYSCSLNQIKINENNSEINLFEFKSNENQLFKYKTLFRGFSFVIRHPIIVTKIGVHQNFLSEDKNLTIILLNAQNKESLKSIEISLKSFSFNQVFYENIEPIILDKDFFGLLIIDDNLLEDKYYYNSNITVNQNGFINVLRSYYGFSDYESIGYKHDHFIGPFLVYKASDEKSVEYLMKSSEQMQIKWNNELIKSEVHLKEEMLSNKDILLVKTMDIYRNLSEKVVQSIQSANDFYDLTHYLKTDDDCYLNVNNIIKELLLNNQTKKVWFGNFRRLWPTDRWGKWAENDYESPLYPPFACGSGYILSADLVHWIASNIDYLHRFQGEDVSMAIWLTTLNPLLIEDKRWVCSDTNINITESFSFPQLSEKQILKIHNFILKDKKQMK